MNGAVRLTCIKSFHFSNGISSTGATCWIPYWRLKKSWLKRKLGEWFLSIFYVTLTINLQTRCKISSLSSTKFTTKKTYFFWKFYVTCIVHKDINSCRKYLVCLPTQFLYLFHISKVTLNEMYLTHSPTQKEDRGVYLCTQSMIDWLIDWIGIYAVSAIFLSYNSGLRYVCGYATKKIRFRY